MILQKNSPEKIAKLNEKNLNVAQHFWNSYGDSARTAHTPRNQMHEIFYLSCVFRPNQIKN